MFNTKIKYTTSRYIKPCPPWSRGRYSISTGVQKKSLNFFCNVWINCGSGSRQANLYNNLDEQSWLTIITRPRYDKPLTMCFHLLRTFSISWITFSQFLFSKQSLLQCYLDITLRTYFPHYSSLCVKVCHVYVSTTHTKDHRTLDC